MVALVPFEKKLPSATVLPVDTLVRFDIEPAKTAMLLFPDTQVVGTNCVNVCGQLIVPSVVFVKLSGIRIV